jgi:hypothetical protein
MCSVEFSLVALTLLTHITRITETGVEILTAAPKNWSLDLPTMQTAFPFYDFFQTLLTAVWHHERSSTGTGQ